MNKDAKVRGFTLIELMVVLAVVAILTSIVYPMYQNHVLTNYRVQAYGSVMVVASELERVRLNRYSYASLDGAVRDSQRYTLNVTASDSEYLIRAVPLDDQVNDRCGSFSFDDRGHWHFYNGKTKRECS